MSKNYIDVSVSTGKPTRVSVSTPANQQNVDVTRDTSAYNAEISKQWATSETLVLNEDYSSKYYANKSKSYAQNAESFEAAVRETYDNIISRSEGIITEIEELKEISEQEISIAVADGLTEINSTKTTILSDIEFVSEGEKEEIKDLVDAGKDEIQELTNEIKDNAEDIINRVSLSMFDTILKDHVLTYEESKGLALQGTYVYKNAIVGSRYGYPDFYAKCLEEYNQATEEMPFIQLANPNGVTSSSGFSNANNAFDGDTSTYASCGTSTDYIEWDLGQTLTISGFSATNNQISSVARACNVAIYSVDGSGNEKLLANGTGAPKAGSGTSSATFTPVKVNKLRFKLIPADSGDAITTQYPSRVTEINIIATVPTWKKNSNGHIFYDISQKDQVDEIFASTGMAWMYGIDQENERIFLPRNKYYSLSLNKDVANVHSRTGSSVDASTVEMMPYFWPDSGALVTGSDAGVVYPGIDSGGRIDRIWNDDTGSHSGTIGHSLYINSSDIVESNTDYYLYICVGNQVQDNSWVDVVTQVANGAKDIEDKRVQALNDLTNKENAGLSALANASNALRETQITNCLLEVPQNIKLELNNGVLTLKAGSKVIVPNGNGVFDEVVINKDTTISYNSARYGLMFYNVTKQSLTHGDTNRAISGATDTDAGLKNWRFWYDTTNNLVKKFETDNTIPIDDLISLPICIFTSDTPGFTSIDQVFNGFGYIGSTIFALPNVKGLIPNGRNANGTLNNTEFVTNNVFTATVSKNKTKPAQIRLRGANLQVGNLKYDSETNYNYLEGQVHIQENIRKLLIVGTYTSDADGKVTSLQLKQPFRAVDYNDKSEISGWGMPSNKYIDLTLGASGTTYTAPANGWFYLAKEPTATNQYIQILVNGGGGTNFSTTVRSAGNVGYVSTFLPCSKGQQVEVSYTTAGTLYGFKFYYAVGSESEV